MGYTTSEANGEIRTSGPYGNRLVSYLTSVGSTNVRIYASMYVDDESNFHIAYYDETNNELKYIENVSEG